SGIPTETPPATPRHRAHWATCPSAGSGRTSAFEPRSGSESGWLPEFWKNQNVYGRCHSSTFRDSQCVARTFLSASFCSASPAAPCGYERPSDEDCDFFVEKTSRHSQGQASP